MTAPFLIRLSSHVERPSDGLPEYRADLYDAELTAMTDHPVHDQGEDYYCTYGPTPLDAVRAAVETIADGSAARHFAEVRTEFGLPGGRPIACGTTSCPNDGKWCVCDGQS